MRLDLTPGQVVEPLDRFSHLRPKGIHNALWWYADFPQHMLGLPSAATEEKGKKAVDLMVTDIARSLRIIKDDQTAPTLQEEFLEKVRRKGHNF